MNFFPCILQYFYLCLIVEVFIGWYRFDSYLNHGFILQNFPMICNLSCIVNSYLERRQKNKFSIILLDSKNGSMSSNLFHGLLISTIIRYPVGQSPNKNIVSTTFNFELSTRRSIQTYEGFPKYMQLPKGNEMCLVAWNPN